MTVSELEMEMRAIKETIGRFVEQFQTMNTSLSDLKTKLTQTGTSGSTNNTSLKVEETLLRVEKALGEVNQAKLQQAASETLEYVDNALEWARRTDLQDQLADILELYRESEKGKTPYQQPEPVLKLRKA